ncbi:class III lanthionine synthetase LanKC [Bacillus nakamurai]|uniref:class III lanthionine synthetase LanKC n=1 Tax=Bacillus nakamurai TaxID=1793963 RepID=UPI0020C1C5AE|nr:class III lanthionine synthetase LanKC [Bacillus nakamurai]MCP6683806.1 class III lanthionine synthetase LanKC [Bacillus nakamurai]
MEGNMLYHQYLKANSEYFGKQEMTMNPYEVNNIPDTYTVISDSNSVWKYYHAKDVSLPEQGWKIHLTSSFEDSQSVLDRVARFCMDEKIEFKHLKDRHSFINMNSKNANRASSGKFITVYPANEEIFVELLKDLSEITKDFKKGPYILSDKRWENSNVFYRYGGFKLILNEQGDHCIRDERGNLIKDQRTPFYQIPDFVKDFDDYLNTINHSDDLEHKEESHLAKYDIKTALSYSNAGGVYLATRKKDNLKVIIKEARPNAGLDGGPRDALERQRIEYDALKKLKNISGVVNLIEYFQEWEHYFLVEEFIEGRDLRQWIAQEYPFLRDTDGGSICDHAKNIKKILLQLFALTDQMHINGVAMGDLQPANVMVTEDLTVKIIDFETAMPVDSEERPKMETIGFVSREMRTGGSRDWFGLKRLVKYLALPVLSSDDLDRYLQDNHLYWIKKNYGESFYHFILALQKECDEKIKGYHQYLPQEIILYNKKRDLNLYSMINKLIRGLENNLTDDERLINGDIRQFEMSEGKFNFLTGGSGAAFMLTKCNSRSVNVDNWIQSFLMDNLSSVKDNGLLTGKTGMLALLYEKGYKEVVLNELNVLRNNVNDTNIALRSGLSGIGLFLISLYFETESTEYLEFAKEIEKLIELNKVKEESLKVNDWMAVGIGLIDGLSGVSLFYSALYSATNNKKYLEEAELLLRKDLEKTKKDDVTGVLQTLDDRNRLLPYLSGGSIGVAVSIWFLNHVSGQDLFKEELGAIVNLSKMRCTISGGLFDGTGSFLLIPSMVDSGLDQKRILMEIMNLLNIFLIKKNDYYVYPGQFSYRLSDDVYTGSSGIVLALMGIVKSNPLYWLPLVNSDEFLVKTKMKNLSVTVN